VRLHGSIGCMGLVGYGSYDTESYKPRGTEISANTLRLCILRVPSSMKSPTPLALVLNYESMKKGTGGFGT
jgi:hypothetical protein